MDSLIVGQETDFKPPSCKDGDAQECVGGFINDGDTSQDWSEVGIVGAGEAAAVAEDYMERAFPALWGQVELGHDAWVCD